MDAPAHTGCLIEVRIIGIIEAKQTQDGKTQLLRAATRSEWIEMTIGNSLAAHSRRKLERLESWSPLGAMVAIGLFILLQWNGYTVFRTHTEDRLAAIEAVSRLSGAAVTPNNKDSQATAKQIIAEARQKSVPLPKSVVEQAGKDFINAAATNDGAWAVALDFITIPIFSESK